MPLGFHVSACEKIPGYLVHCPYFPDTVNGRQSLQAVLACTQVCKSHNMTILNGVILLFLIVAIYISSF